MTFPQEESAGSLVECGREDHNRLQKFLRYFLLKRSKKYYSVFSPNPSGPKILTLIAETLMENHNSAGADLTAECYAKFFEVLIFKAVQKFLRTILPKGKRGKSF